MKNRTVFPVAGSLEPQNDEIRGALVDVRALVRNLVIRHPSDTLIPSDGDTNATSE